VKILIADDDPQIREVLSIAVERAGFVPLTVADGPAALREALRSGPDLLVLDIGLPHMDGLEVCRRIRATSALPILFLTAQGDEVDRVVGLELGADDYVAKPFSPRELVARIKAILKRGGVPGPERATRRRGALALDPEAQLCTFDGQPVALTATEMALLGRLLARPDHVTSRAQLFEAVYGGHAEVSDRTVDSHLRNLRRKLAEAGCVEALETVHGLGIRMGPCRAA
jgi:two-component system OmpR family response regulator